MSTTYYSYGEKYFRRRAEGTGGKDEIFRANGIEKEVACSSRVFAEPCYSMQRRDSTRAHLRCRTRCIAVDSSEVFT